MTNRDALYKIGAIAAKSHGAVKDHPRSKMKKIKLRVRWPHLRHFRQLSHREQRLLLQARCWLPLMHGDVRWIGFKQLCRLLTRWSAQGTSLPQAEQGRLTISQGEQALHRAVQHGLYSGNCLSRSLMLWWLLRRQGVDSALRIGVRTVDGQFQAHAWIEYQGQPLHEIQDVHQHYTAFHDELFTTLTHTSG